MESLPDGYALHAVESVSSTSDEARHIFGDLAGPTWILAQEQTAARGRRGRAWVSPKGNFAATLVMPIGRIEDAALRSFIAALAVREASVALTGRDAEFRLKWPNDVLLRGSKLAGILLESLGTGGATTHLAVGIGVNLIAAPPPDMLEARALPSVSLAGATGVKSTPEAFLAPLAHAFARYEQQFVTYGFAPVRTAWLAHAAGLGEVITARTAQYEITGTFVDVDDTGQLVLETPKGRMTLPAADIHF